MTRLKVIDTADEVLQLQEYIATREFVAYDTETTGLTKRHEIIGFSVCADEEVAYYVILAKYNPDTKQLDYLPLREDAISLLKTLKSKNLIMHNGVFDCYMTEANFKVQLKDSLHTDTMILAHLLDENRSVALKELARKMYGESATKEKAEMEASIVQNGGAIQRDNYELYKADAYLIGKYGAQDAALTFRLFMDLTIELHEQDLADFFFEESMPLLRGPTYDLNTTGLLVDTQALSMLKNLLKAESAELKAFIEAEIKPYIKDKYPGTTKKNTFNIGASQQLAWLLFGQLRLEFQTLTKIGKDVCRALGMKLPYTRAAKTAFITTCLEAKGQLLTADSVVNGRKRKGKTVAEPWKYIQCDNKTLTKLAPKHEWIAALIQYQKKIKILNTYIEGLEERIQYGVLHPQFLQHGTKTGRYSSKNPNFQNLPRDDQRVKDCIIARPGKVFVSADYSQLEPRVFASYSKDERLMAAFTGETDFYSVVGMETFDKYDCTPQKEGDKNAFGVKYKNLRHVSKQIALATAYGSTAYKLATIAGSTTEEMAEAQNKYLERFPGVKTMMLEAHELVKKNGYVTNLFGRKRRIPEARQILKIYGNADHGDLPYEVRKLLNAACNFRIQSTGGSIINRAAIQFYNNCKKLGLDVKFISQIHDELVIEANENDADKVVSLLRQAMENTTELPGVPLEAEPRISKTLAK